jgi:hypothetical protein
MGRPRCMSAKSRTLGREPHKWFVVQVFSSVPVPEELFIPLLSSAIREPNPSANGNLVQCCMAYVGPRRVNEALLDFVEKGTGFEKEGR